MTNLQQRLERLEVAVKASAPESAGLYFPSDWSKEDRIESMMLVLRKAPDADASVTDEELRARAVAWEESGEFDAPEDAPKDAG